MESTPDAAVVERSLATYYDNEAANRAERDLDPQRVAARERFIDQLDTNDALLEIGTGPGRDASSFVEAGMPTFGVDLSPEHATLANLTGARVVVGSARRLPFCDRAFGALWTMSTLMHVPEHAITGALRELSRVLAPESLAAIGVWGGPDVEHYLDSDIYQPPRLFSRRSDRRWRSMLSEIGTVEEFENWGRREDDFWYQWAVVRIAKAPQV